ncbi:hypothetical protein [Escherichia albertii]|uniref:hypothetical protein n=1 Tax=Escherichia albertii TaxID=208962 RepID=UPI001FC9E8DB|nr:hypothetical protein [Escherichia albertii]
MTCQKSHHLPFDYSLFPPVLTLITAALIIVCKRLIRTVWQIPDALDKVSTTKLIVGDKNVRYAKKCLSGKT